MNEKAVNKMLVNIDQCTDKIIKTLLNDYKFNELAEVGELTNFLASEFEKVLNEKIMDELINTTN